MPSWGSFKSSTKPSSISASARSFSGTSSRSTSTKTVDRSSASSQDGNHSDCEDSSPKRTIYLIRHAESKENVKMHGLQEVGMSLSQKRLPSSKDVSNGFKFIGGAAMGDIDSDLSEGGKAQVKELFHILDSDRKKNTSSLIKDVDITGHSPLIRARDTCYGVFGLDKNEKYDNVVQLTCLEEATPWETIVQGRKKTVHERIKQLQNWIDNQKDAKTIALVGHSEYFMIMLGISRAEKFWNCDVWKVEYGAGKWTGLELKHRLPSSKPMGVM